MNDIVKRIRMASKLSRQAFADVLRVSSASVKSWEDGNSIPNTLNQDHIYTFCQENSIPVTALVLEKVQAVVSRIDTEENRIILYHGSQSGIQGKIAPVSSRRCDFGSGFYMAAEPLHPLALISGFEHSKFYIVSIDMSGMNKLCIDHDLEWAMAIAFNRGKLESIHGSNLYHKYLDMTKGTDIVMGNIASDTEFYILDNFFTGNITDKALTKSLAALKPGKQYTAVTQKGCDHVRLEKEIELSYLERRCIQDMGEENRTKGIRLVNGICKKYRRSGLYFDELLAQTSCCGT